MKKILISLIAVATILGGCAKVRYEEAGCAGTKPRKPVIDAYVLASQYGSTISAYSPDGGTLIWTTPSGVSTQSYTLTVDQYSLGTYTVKARVDGCSSDPTTFQVVDQLPVLYGTPPCAPFANSNVFSSSSGTFLNFASGYLSSGYSSYYNRFEIYGSDYYGSDLSIYLPTTTAPSTGTYFELDSNGTSSSGGAYATTAFYTGTNYTAVSGRIYIYSNNGSTSVAMCNVIWRAGYNRKSVTGVCRYY